jgi:hypothetical protein
VPAWAAALASFASGRALEPSDILAYSTGPLVIRTHCTASQQFTDNVLYSSARQISDYVAVFKPSVAFSVGKPDSQTFITFAYRASSQLYGQQRQFDSLDHSARLELELQGAKLTLAGRFELQDVSSVYGGYSSFIQAGTGQAQGLGALAFDRIIYNLHQKVEYSYKPKTTIYAEGHYNGLDFRRRVDALDIDTVRATLGFSWLAFPKTRILGELFSGQSSSGPNAAGVLKSPHVNSLGGYIGAEGSFTSKMKGVLKIGFEQSAYASGLSALSSPVVEAEVSEEFSEKTSAKLNYSRRSTLSITSSGQAVVSDFASAQISQVIGTRSKFVATAATGYGHNEYAPLGRLRARSDDYFRGAAELLYRHRLWLSVGLAYEFESLLTRPSAGFDYQVNRVSITLTVGY